MILANISLAFNQSIDYKLVQIMQNQATVAHVSTNLYIMKHDDYKNKQKI